MFQGESRIINQDLRGLAPCTRISVSDICELNPPKQTYAASISDETLSVADAYPIK